MAHQLPVLDISASNDHIATHLVQSVSQHGFVYIKNHGLDLPPSDVDDMFQLARDFFNSPLKEKAEYAVNSTASGKNSGWFGMNVETLDPGKQRIGDFKEAFNMNEFVNGKSQQLLPPLLEKKEQQIADFINKCHTVCLKILSLFALGLEIDQDVGGTNWFLSRHDSTQGPSGSVFRMLYYPSIPKSSLHSESDLRCGAHSDYGTITLLFQRNGQPGLEIQTDAESDSWAPVPVNPTGEAEIPILVNVGDLLSYWTNGVLRSTVHRVTLPTSKNEEDRYSMAYFCHPLDSALLEPVPSTIVQQHGSGATKNTQAGEKRVMTAKEHLENRLQATYG